MEADGVELGERHFPGRQGRLLFAYLVAENGREVPRDELADVLWGDAVPATWEKALSVLASKLRAALSEAGVDGATALTAAFGCYRLDLPAGTWVDILEAASATGKSELLLEAGEPEKAADAAGPAESVTRLPFLPGDDGPWVHAKRRELADVRARALAVLAEASQGAGKPAEAVRWAEQAVEAEQFRESGYRLLMTAHIAAGNRAEALRVYERCRQLLAEELGAYPSPETESLYRELLETPPPRQAAAQPEAPPPATGRRRLRMLALVTFVVAAALAAVFALDSSGGGGLRPDSVLRIDPKTLKATEVAQVGDAPDLIVAAGGYLWVTNDILRDTAASGIRNAGDRTLTRVNPSTGRTSPVGGAAPCGLAADPSGGVWVANCVAAHSSRSSTVQLIDAKSLRFEQTWAVPGGGCFYRGLAYGGGSLWASDVPPCGSSSDVHSLRQVDPRTGEIRTIRIGGYAGALGWSDRYGDLWITNFPDGSVTRLHADTGTQTVAPDGINPASVVSTRNATWVADWSAPQVLRLDPAGPGKPLTVRLPVSRGSGCPKYSCVWTVAAGSGAVWATTPEDHAVWRIDPKTNDVTRVRLPYEPTGVTVAAGEVWVTVRGR